MICLDMHLIVDLPLSSTNDLDGYQWYGSIKPFNQKIIVISFHSF
jgi:hypothetical protein